MYPVRRIYFGPFSPDGPDRDAAELDDAQNVLPLWGAHRSCPAPEVGLSISTPSPATGVHAHLISPSSAQVTFAGDEDIQTAGNWNDFGAETELPAGEMWSRVSGPIPSDLTGMRLQQYGPQTPAQNQIGLADLIDPGVDDGWKLRLRYRVIRPQDMTDFVLVTHVAEGGSSLENFIHNLTLHGDSDDPVTKEWDVDSATIAAITDFADLELWWSCNITATPPDESLVGDSWVSGEGLDWERSDADLSRDLVEYFADTADFIELQDVEGDDEVVIQVRLEETLPLLPPVDSMDGGGWKFRAHLDCVGGDFDIEMEGRAGSVTLTEVGDPEADPPVDPPIDTITPGSVQIVERVVPDGTDLPDVWDDFRIWLKATLTAGGTTSSYYRPNGGSGTGWTAVGAAQLWLAIDEETLDEDDYVQTALDGDQPTLIMDTDGGSPPVSSKAKVYVVAQVANVAGGNRGRFKLALRQGGVDLATLTKDVYQNDGTTEVKLEVPDAVKSDVSDWGSVQLRLDKRTPSGSWQARCYQAYIEVQEPDDVGNDLRIHKLELVRPSSCGIEVRDIRLVSPAGPAVIPGDQVREYVGTENSLFEITPSGAVDLSQTTEASYGAGSTRLASWSFTSWGDRVIATNFQDEIQVQNALGQRFEDLIDLTALAIEFPDLDLEKPRARHVGVVREYLVLAGVDLDTDPGNDFNEYTVWWARAGAPDLFLKVDLGGDSDYQPLVDPPGEITGFSGGEVGYLTKRSGVWRMDFVGYPTTFDFTLISRDGTAYGRSLVRQGDRVFWFGLGGFRTYAPEDGVARPIGDGRVTRMLIDAIYEDRAFLRTEEDDSRKIDAAFVGEYDPWSRLVLWFYRGIEDNAYSNRMGLAYNPATGHWAPLAEVWGNRGFCAVSALPHLQQVKDSMLHGFRLYSWNGDTQLDVLTLTDRRTLPARLRTKIFSSEVLGGQAGRGVTIHGVRPFFRTRKRLTALELEDIAFSVDVVGGRDPELRCETAARTINSRDDAINKAGWIMLGSPLEAEFFQCSMALGSLRDGVLQEIQGLEFLLDPEGDEF